MTVKIKEKRKNEVNRENYKTPAEATARYDELYGEKDGPYAKWSVRIVGELDGSKTVEWVSMRIHLNNKRERQ